MIVSRPQNVLEVSLGDKRPRHVTLQGGINFIFPFITSAIFPNILYVHLDSFLVKTENLSITFYVFPFICLTCVMNLLIRAVSAIVDRLVKWIVTQHLLQYGNRTM